MDLVHARSRAPAWASWFAVRRTGRHFVTTYHGAYGENLPFKRRYNAVMAKGERVIVASQFMAGLVSAQHGVGRDRLRLIPRGVDPAVFDPAAVTPDGIAALRDSWSIEQAVPVIMLPGRITGWKGQTILLQAAARMQRRDPLIVLLGAPQSDDHLRTVRSEAERLGLAQRLRVPGDCADMPAALALADVVVHASTEPEAFGRVVIEAQAMARPVIASDLGGPVETVEDGVTGWRAPPGDAQALADRLDRVLTMDAAKRADVGAAARAAVLRSFTTRAMQQATLAVYREVLGIYDSRLARFCVDRVSCARWCLRVDHRRRRVAPSAAHGDHEPGLAGDGVVRDGLDRLAVFHLWPPGHPPCHARRDGA